MEYIPTEIKDVLLIKPSIFEDKRGYFFESFRQSILREQGIDVQFVQDNVSWSQMNTLRGLHYQIENSQDKLITVLKGEIMDIAVDLRKNKSTFGQHVGRVLSSQNHHQLFIPKGFAHGFSVLSDQALVYYKCSDYYNPEGERGLKWNDPDLNIEWKVNDPIVSEKDQQHPRLKEITSNNLFA